MDARVKPAHDGSMRVTAGPEVAGRGSGSQQLLLRQTLFASRGYMKTSSDSVSVPVST
jgi:hypothetical protein